MKKYLFFILLWLPVFLNGQSGTTATQRHISNDYAVNSDTATWSSYLIPTFEYTNRTIYVDSVSGNDETGSGSVSYPYQSIYKAVSTIGINCPVIITIHLDTAGYIIDSSVTEMFNKFNFYGLGTIYFTGIFDFVSSGFTVSATNDLNTYKCTGASWDDSEIRHHLIKFNHADIRYAPIVDNWGTDTIRTIVPQASKIIDSVFTTKTKVFISSYSFPADRSNTFNFQVGTYRTFSFYKCNVVFESDETTIDITAGDIGIHSGILDIDAPATTAIRLGQNSEFKCCVIRGDEDYYFAVTANDRDERIFNRALIEKEGAQGTWAFYASAASVRVLAWCYLKNWTYGYYFSGGTLIDANTTALAFEDINYCFRMTDKSNFYSTNCYWNFYNCTGLIYETGHNYDFVIQDYKNYTNPSFTDTIGAWDGIYLSQLKTLIIPDKYKIFYFNQSQRVDIDTLVVDTIIYR